MSRRTPSASNTRLQTSRFSSDIAHGIRRSEAVGRMRAVSGAPHAGPLAPAESSWARTTSECSTPPAVLSWRCSSSNCRQSPWSPTSVAGRIRLEHLPPRLCPPRGSPDALGQPAECSFIRQKDVAGDEVGIHCADRWSLGFYLFLWGLWRTVTFQQLRTVAPLEVPPMVPANSSNTHSAHFPSTRPRLAPPQGPRRGGSPRNGGAPCRIGVGAWVSKTVGVPLQVGGQPRSPGRRVR